jgi:hypothetical protein
MTLGKICPSTNIAGGDLVGPPPPDQLTRHSNVVARDGIEPPTPAFSGHKSPMAMSLILNVLVIITTLKTAVLLE